MMTEKRDKKVKSTAKRKKESAAERPKGRTARGAGMKRNSAKWLSPDSFMGKVLCILLVIILTVGAFLAPKLINNLYDAGTLLQITYVDMELSPYAVVYASFEDKLKAIARANTAGDHFMTLSAEETEGKIGDAELVEAVNREMKQMSGSQSILLFESWWGKLTEESLVSREKNTIYMQPQRSGAEGDSLQETVPIQFWTLTFEMTQEQMEEQIKEGVGGQEEYDKLSEAEKKMFAKSYIWNVTDKLIVCMDTDFYKIYAVAVEGEESRIGAMYDLPKIFEQPPQSEWEEWNRYLESGYMDMRMNLIDVVTADWADYWNVTPEEKSIYLNVRGELSGCLTFREDERGENSGEAQDTAESADPEGGFAYNEAGVGYAGEGVMDSAVVVENVEDTIWIGNAAGDNEILLEVGYQGGFDEQDESLWIQKAGCRNFFEMMQF